MFGSWMVPTAVLMLVAYLVGSIPFSFLVAKLYGVDLRKVGSGNIGGANVWRNCGFGAFLMAITGDIGKGWLPTFVALHLHELLSLSQGAPLPPLAVVLVGLSAILGHTYPLYLSFKGGKAVATSGGVLLAIAPLLMLLGVVGWVIAFAITRFSSVGSLTAAAVVLVLSIVQLVQGQLPLAYAVFIWAAVVLIVYLHRENIQRLRNGTENRFSRQSQGR
jgi:glycerol-3-phosphate acyltransferase PlsY